MAETLLDDLGEVAVEYLTRIGKRHRWVRTDLLFDALPVTPLLRHPIGGYSGRHRFQNKDEPAGAVSVAVYKHFLFAALFDPLKRGAYLSIGDARHACSPLRLR